MEKLLAISPLLALSLAACGAEEAPKNVKEESSEKKILYPSCEKNGTKIEIKKRPLGEALQYKIGSDNFEFFTNGKVARDFIADREGAFYKFYKSIKGAQDQSKVMPQIIDHFKMSCDGVAIKGDIQKYIGQFEVPSAKPEVKPAG